MKTLEDLSRTTKKSWRVFFFLSREVKVKGVGTNIFVGKIVFVNGRSRPTSYKRRLDRGAATQVTVSDVLKRFTRFFSRPFLSAHDTSQVRKSVMPFLLTFPRALSADATILARAPMGAGTSTWRHSREFSRQSVCLMSAYEKKIA